MINGYYFGISVNEREFVIFFLFDNKKNVERVNSEVRLVTVTNDLLQF